MTELVKDYAVRATAGAKRAARKAGECGSEIVQTVIVLGFAVGLGVALIALQGNVEQSIDKAGSSIVSIFDSATER